MALAPSATLVALATPAAHEGNRQSRRVKAEVVDRGQVVRVAPRWMPGLLATLYLALAAMGLAVIRFLSMTPQQRADENGFVDLKSILGIAGGAIAIVLSVSIIVGFIPNLVASSASAVDNVTTADFGNDSVNLLREPMGLLIGVSMLFGIVALIIGVINFKR